MMVGIFQVEDANYQNEGYAREEQTHGRNDGTEHPTQAIPREHGNVHRIEPWHGLTDRQAGHELVVIQPVPFFGQEDFLVGNDATAKADGADQEEFEKDFPESGRWDGFRGFIHVGCNYLVVDRVAGPAAETVRPAGRWRAGGRHYG